LWAHSAAYQGYYISASELNAWWAVDLGTLYGVKRVQFRSRHDAHGTYTGKLDVLVGKVVPKGPVPLGNPDDYLLCAHWPYKSALGSFSGVTCNCLSVGRYVVIVDNLNGHFSLVEVAVNGILYADLIKNEQ